MSKQLIKYDIGEVEGDGECLFNAVAYGIIFLTTDFRPTRTEYKPLAKKLRALVVKEQKRIVNSNNMDYIVSLAGNYNNSSNSSSSLKNKAYKYIKKMSKKKTWGGQAEVLLLGEMVKSYGFKGIKVYDDSNKKEIKEMRTKNLKSNSNVIHLVLENVSMGGLHFNFWNKSASSSNSNSKKTSPSVKIRR